jgi:hypothetical protein
MALQRSSKSAGEEGGVVGGRIKSSVIWSRKACISINALNDVYIMEECKNIKV